MNIERRHHHHHHHHAATTTSAAAQTMMNGEFGVLLDPVTRGDLSDPHFQSRAHQLWMHHGGLLAVRGGDLRDISPAELVAWSAVFGSVEEEIPASRQDKVVPGYPILRIGNIRDERTGQPAAQFSVVPPLESDADIQYNPATRRPVWHTDSTFRPHPPIGSVLHCRQAPPAGGATLFADTATALARLGGDDDDQKRQLESLEAICSLAHHDQKIHSYSPDYPVLSPEQRAANPPRRVPLVLHHPATNKPALYGWNSSTCAIVPRGQEISQSDQDRWDLQGVEDDSVQIWRRDLLPFVTSPEFTVKFEWQPGDIVVWDNRCTLHSATGFDHGRYTREMWRLTLLEQTEAAVAVAAAAAEE